MQPESQFSIGPEAPERHLDNRSQFRTPEVSWNGGSRLASERHVDDRAQFDVPGGSQFNSDLQILFVLRHLGLGFNWEPLSCG